MIHVFETDFSKIPTEKIEGFLPYVLQGRYPSNFAVSCSCRILHPNYLLQLAF